MLDQLGAESAADDIDDLYGPLIGVWDVVNHYRAGDVEKHGTVVWTFGRILAGRGVQDVMWFTAPGDDGYPVRMTGSTVRLFDPAGAAWRVVWFSPGGTTGTLTARPGEHGDIVQEGTNSAGKSKNRMIQSMEKGCDGGWQRGTRPLLRSISVRI